MEYGHERNMPLPCHRRARDKALHYPGFPQSQHAQPVASLHPRTHATIPSHNESAVAVIDRKLSIFMPLSAYHSRPYKLSKHPQRCPVRPEFAAKQKTGDQRASVANPLPPAVVRADRLYGSRYASRVGRLDQFHTSYQRSTRRARSVFQRLALPMRVSISNGIYSG